MTSAAETRSSEIRDLDALIIGAGFSGLYQLLCLRDRLGLSAQVLEAAGGVGGTWYWNRYPGARCDSESHAYCYSFDEDLMREWQWSERYPEQPEILRYLNHVADRFDLKRDIRFNTRVAAAHYDEAANRWHVRTEAGEDFTAQFLITAVGCLSTANVPNIPGLETLRRELVPHRAMAARRRRFQRQARRGRRHRIDRHPGHPGDRRNGRPPDRVPAHRQLQRAGPQCSADRREFKRWVRENTAEIRQTTRSTPNGHPFVISERLARATPAEERQRSVRSGVGKRRPAVPRDVPGSAGGQGGERHRRRRSSAARSGRS